MKIEHEHACVPHTFLGRALRLMQSGTSTGWLIITSIQGVLTVCVVVLSRFFHGHPYETTARSMAILAIVISWSFALKTIRVRIVELARMLQEGTPLLKKMIERGAAPLGMLQKFQELQGSYTRQSIFYLQLIALGITLPFFLLPLLASIFCIAFTCGTGLQQYEFFSFAALLGVMAVIVGTYFYWSVRPVPARVRMVREQLRE